MAPFVESTPEGIPNLRSAEEIRQLVAGVPESQDFPASWMSQLLSYIGDRTLETICVPRSHDAGMYSPIHLRKMGSSSTVITQSHDILSQLKLGVRMFDLRPCIVRGQFYCGHYSYIKPSDIGEAVRGIAGIVLPDLIGWYSGGEGASLKQIIDQVNEFTETSHEVVILEVTHTFNFDREVYNGEWAHELNQTEWDRLTTELNRLNHLHTSAQGSTAAITKVPIRELIGSGHAAVIVTTARAGEINLGSAIAGKGFYEQGVLDRLRQKHLSREQTPIEAVCGYLRDNDHSIFANTVASLFGGDSIYIKQEIWAITDTAQRINQEELPRILETVSAEGYPNFVSTDNVTDRMLLDAVLQVLGLAITGKKNVSLRLESGGKWTFVEK